MAYFLKLLKLTSVLSDNYFNQLPRWVFTLSHGLGSVIMNTKFEDPFNGWGKKAAAFCIAFAFILPNYFFMTKVLNWF